MLVDHLTQPVCRAYIIISIYSCLSALTKIDSVISLDREIVLSLIYNTSSVDICYVAIGCLILSSLYNSLCSAVEIVIGISDLHYELLCRLPLSACKLVCLLGAVVIAHCGYAFRAEIISAAVDSLPHIFLLHPCVLRVIKVVYLLCTLLICIS